MEKSSISRDKPFSFQEITTEEMDSWMKNLISQDDNIFTNFESLSPLFNQYGLSPDQTGLEGSTFSGKRPIQETTTDSNGKRSKSNTLTVPRSLSYSLNDKMLKALSLFMEFSGEAILAQFWTPIKSGDQNMLSTCDQAYLLDSRLSRYREVSRTFTFSAEANQCSYPGLPGRVFISGVPEWTSNVMYYNTAEYLRMKYALDNEVRGSIALPVFETSESGRTSCAVLELVTCREKPNFDMEMDSVCRALQAVNLQTSTIPRRQYLSSNQKEALAEIRDVLRAVCHAHRLPVALAWIPCSYTNGADNGLVKVYGKSSKESLHICIEETSCYVNDTEMQGFVNACSGHDLRQGQGIVGKAMISNKPSFSSDVKLFDISEYPLVHHARKYGLNAAVATKLRSTFTGDDDYILEFFLPLSMKGSSEQQLLLDSLSGTMQRICRTLRTISDAESTIVSDGSFEATLMDTDVNSNRNTFSNISSDKTNDVASSQGTLQQDIAGARRSEKKKSTTEKNVSLSVLQQYFSGSLKDAAKSIGVCPTTLKRICRQHGIMRWPSRKINKVNRSLRKIQTVLDSVQGVEGGLKFDSVTGEFVAVGSFTQASPSSHNDGRSQEDIIDVKFGDGAVKLELEEGLGSLMETWAWTSKPSGLNHNEGFDIGKNTIPGTSEPNTSFSSSMSDSSNGSGAVNAVRSPTTSNEQDRNQTKTCESVSILTVKATYRNDTIRFKIDPNVVECSHLYKEVGKRFKLQDSAFQLKYLDDEDEWVMLVTDSDLNECLEILNSTRKNTVKFMVRDLPPSAIGSSGGSNGYL